MRHAGRYIGVGWLVVGLISGCGNGGSGGDKTGSTSEAAFRTAGPSTSETFTVPLNPGWNGVAFQVRNVSSISGASVASLTVYSGNGYTTGNADAATVNDGDGAMRGFWLFSTSAGQVTYSGDDTGRSPVVSLRSGWNFVALPAKTALPSTDVKAYVNGSPVSLGSVILPQVYQVQSNGQYRVVDLVAGGSLEPGGPCWIFASQPVQLAYAGFVPPPGSSPAPTPTPTNNPNQLLSGPYGLISATLGAGRRTASVGDVIPNGSGGISGGSVTTVTYIPATNQLVTGTSTITGGQYSVSPDRRFTGAISDSRGVQTQVTNAGVTANSNFAGGNWLDSDGAAGQFAMLRGLDNPNNQVLNGAYRFTIGWIGPFGGYAAGVLSFNGNGQCTGGSLSRSDGSNDVFTGGSYTVNSNSTVNATLNLQSGIVATVTGYAGRDKTMAFAVRDNLGNVGTGLANPGATGTASNADLAGKTYFLALRTAPNNGLGYATGHLIANGLGTFTGGDIFYNDGVQATATGTYSIASNGIGSLSASISNGAVANSGFFLHADRQAASGYVSDSFGNRGVLILVK